MMKTDVVPRITVSVIWNDCVEVTNIWADGSRLYFLGLDQEIKDLLVLSYTEDDRVLSCSDAGFKNLGEWVESAVKNLEGVEWSPTSPNCGVLVVHLKDVLPKRNRVEMHTTNEGKDITYTAIFDQVGVSKQFTGFPTQLRAERFLAHLIYDNHLYFIDFEDCELEDIRSLSSRQLRQELYVRKSYGSMRWSLNEGDCSCEDRSFYFDYYRLPEWTGHVVAQVSTAEQIFDIDIIKPSELKAWARDSINIAIEWLGEIDETNWDELKVDVELLKSDIYRQIDRDLARWGYKV